MNIGSADRIVRIVMGSALIAIAFIQALPLSTIPALQWGLAAVGVVLIATALVRLCPLYMLFGLSTCKVPNR